MLLKRPVTFASATAVGGVAADTLNSEFQITRVIDANNYEITVSSAATSTVAGGGGSSVTAEYQINTGLDTSVGGTGRGAGTWGGVAAGPLQTTINEGAELLGVITDMTVRPAVQVVRVANDFVLIGDEILKAQLRYLRYDLTVTRGQQGTDASAHADGSIAGKATQYRERLL